MLLLERFLALCARARSGDLVAAFRRRAVPTGGGHLPDPAARGVRSQSAARRCPAPVPRRHRHGVGHAPGARDQVPNDPARARGSAPRTCARSECVSRRAAAACRNRAPSACRQLAKFATSSVRSGGADKLRAEGVAGSGVRDGTLDRPVAPPCTCRSCLLGVLSRLAARF